MPKVCSTRGRSLHRRSNDVSRSRSRSAKPARMLESPNDNGRPDRNICSDSLTNSNEKSSGLWDKSDESKHLSLMMNSKILEQKYSIENAFSTIFFFDDITNYTICSYGSDVLALFLTVGPLIAFNNRKSENSKSSVIKTILAIASIVYLLAVLYEVFEFLEMYYLTGNSPIAAVKALPHLQRLFIAFSYILIDAVYPVSFFLLYCTLLSGILKDTTKEVIKQCGLSNYEELRKTLTRQYYWHIMYAVVHTIVLFAWLFQKYPVEDTIFWSFVFGIPHVLCPILLTIILTRIFSLCDARISFFRQRFLNGLFEDVDELWDSFQELRQYNMSVSQNLQNVIGSFALILFLSIICQACAVFLFKGEAFSLVYMMLNIWCLLSVLHGAQNLYSAFAAAADDIMHSPTTSILGSLDSQARGNIVFVLVRDDIFPSIKAFNLSLSVNTFFTIVSTCAFSVLSILWETYGLGNYVRSALEETGAHLRANVSTSVLGA